MTTCPALRLARRLLLAAMLPALLASAAIPVEAVSAPRTATPDSLDRAVSMQPLLTGVSRSEPSLCKEGVDGVVRSTIPGSERAGTIVVGPAFTEVANLQPSTTYRYCMLLHNQQDSVHRFELQTVDLVGSPNPDQQQQILEPPSAFGTWIRLAVDAVTLQPAEQAIIPYTITTPASLPGGSLAAAIKVVQSDSTAGSGGGARVVPALLERIYLTLPGGVARPLTVSSVRAPRLLQRSKRQLTYTARFNVRNVGTITDAFEVELEVRGLGRTVGRVQRPLATILPGGATRVELVWRDVPWIGWYRPRAIVDSRAGDVEVQLPGLVVLPPTPYLIALIAAVLLPLVVLLRAWRRRRAEWMSYLEQEQELEEDELDTFGFLHPEASDGVDGSQTP